MIAILKKELETIDVFRAFFPVGDVLEHEDHLIRIFAKSFCAQPRLIPVALWPFDCGLHELHGFGVFSYTAAPCLPPLSCETRGRGRSICSASTIQPFNALTFRQLPVSDGFKRCVVRLTVFSKAPRACRVGALA